MRRMRLPAALAAVAVLEACGGNLGNRDDQPFREQPMHRFDIAAAPATVCTAARKVLLGDGYVVARASPEDDLALIGTREFMAEKDHPAVLQFHASCQQSAAGTALFATAVESRFEISQTKQKTSVGIPIVAPISVSSTTTSEAMVKVGGETLREEAMYRRFFAAVMREIKPR